MVKIVCDSGPLISFSDTCLINVLGFLSKRGAEFLIPRSVEQEIVSTPLKIRRYAFSAVRLHKAIDDGVLKVVDVDNLLVDRIMRAANGVFSVRGNALKILHAGEVAALAACKKYNCEALVIDEKTTRLLIEDPALLQEKISDEYHARVAVNSKNLAEFNALTKGVQILRSTDLAAVAAKKGYFTSFGKHSQQAFQTSIYALKQAGCSVSEKEVSDYQAIKL